MSNNLEHLKSHRRGLMVVLSSPSGAGKSSLLKLMYLALKPSRGLVTLFGKDIAKLEAPVNSIMEPKLYQLYINDLKK